MKNKGFTLVELLAVIAILAILVIIALPNVMKMFNDAKENAFKTELKNIYKTAEQTWMSESMFDTKEKVYARCKNNTCPNTLPLSGRTELEYYIKVSKSGKIVEFKASDGTYQYRFNGSELKVEDIKTVEKVADLGSDNIIGITCNGSTGGGSRIVYLNDKNIYDRDEFPGNNIFIGSHLPNNLISYDSEQDYLNNSNENVFLKIVEQNDIITEAYVGFKYNGNIYYLPGGGRDTYDESNALIKSVFGESNCDEYASFISCTVPEIRVGLDRPNYAGAYNSNIFCGIRGEDGWIYCY